MILDLKDVGLSDLKVFGSKIAVLGELSKEGIRVPPALVIHPQLFESWCEEQDQLREIRQKAKANLSDVSLWKTLFNKFSERISTAESKMWLRHRLDMKRIETFIDAHGFIVVRSSSVAEDSSKQSFAGLYESVLNIQSEQDFIEALLKVWVACFDCSAIEYAAAHGQSPAFPSFGVLIQRQVQADLSGVLFSVDPVTGDHLQLVVQASEKGTDAITSGREVGVEVRAVKAGESYAGIDRENADKIETLGLKELIEVAPKIVGIMGRPQDIEWAIEKGQVNILQSRPITSLTSYEYKGESPFVFFRSRFGRELYPGVFTPLAATLALAVIQKAEKWFITKFAGVPHIAPVSRWVDGFFYMDRGLRLSYMNAAKSGFRAPFYKRRDWAFVLDFVFGFLWIKNQIGKIERKMKSNSVHPEKLTAIEKVSHLKKLSATLGEALILSQAYMSLYEIIFSFVRKMVRKKMGPQFSSEQLFSRISESAIGEGHYSELHRMADFVREKPALLAFLKSKTWLKSPEPLAEFKGDEGRVLKEMLDQFLEKHGFHGVIDTNIYLPSWSENPSAILETIGALAMAPRPKSFNQNKEPEIRLGILGRFLVSRLIRLLIIREELRTLWVKAFRAQRPLVLAIGAGLPKTTFKDDSDVFFLTFEELDWAVSERARHIDFQDIISSRRKAFEMQSKKLPPEEMIIDVRIDGGASPLNAWIDKGENSNELTGLCACPGSVDAPVFIMLQPETTEAPENAGDYIYVLPYLDRGWWPWLCLAKGLIIDRGGILSHGAILSRELGIPTVINTRHASHVLKTGDIVRLDATKGSVIRINGQNSSKEVKYAP